MRLTTRSQRALGQILEDRMATQPEIVPLADPVRPVPAETPYQEPPEFEPPPDQTPPSPSLPEAPPLPE